MPPLRHTAAIALLGILVGACLSIDIGSPAIWAAISAVAIVAVLYANRNT